MSTFIMLVVLVIVIATSVGVFFWFNRKLKDIEVELWGEKRKEATETAMHEHDKDINSENDDNKTEH